MRIQLLAKMLGERGKSALQQKHGCPRLSDGLISGQERSYYCLIAAQCRVNCWWISDPAFPPPPAISWCNICHYSLQSGNDKLHCYITTQQPLWRVQILCGFTTILSQARNWNHCKTWSFTLLCSLWFHYTSGSTRFLGAKPGLCFTSRLRLALHKFLSFMVT